MKNFGVFASFLWYSLATSDTRKHLRESFLTTAVWRTRRPHTLHQEYPSILRVTGPCEELYCSCLQVKCKRLIGGRFLSLFVDPKFRPISTTGAPLSRGLRLCEEPAGFNLERNTSFCDEPLSSHRRSPVSTNQPKF